MRRLTVVGSAIALLFPATAAFAQGPWCPWGANAPAVSPWQQTLELTEAQSKQLDALRTQYQQQAATLTTSLQAKSLELRRISLAQNADPKEVAALTAEIAQLRTDLSKARLDHQAAVKNVLTEDQRTKLTGLSPCPYGGPGLGFGRGRGVGSCGLDVGCGRGYGRGMRGGRGFGGGRGRCAWGW